jgi:hypothetical protein
MVTRQQHQRGFTLEATMIFLVLLTAVIGTAIATMVMVQRTEGIDYRGSRVTYATEAGADHVMSQLATHISDGILTDPELAAITAPAIPGFTFGTPTATRAGAAIYKLITKAPYSGLYSLNQQIDIRTDATDPAGNRSSVVVSVNAQSIPLFQFGVFYEDDLEIHNGPRMDFAGWVHTNSNLYLTSDNTYFQDNVTAADSVIWRRKATNQRLNGVYIDDKDGNAVALTFDSRSDPGHSFVTKSNNSFDGRLMSSASGVTPLNLPLPDGLPTTTMVERRNAGDDAAISNVKFSRKADLHIEVKTNRLSLAPATFCDDDPAVGAMVMDRGPRPKPSEAECQAIFSGEQDLFRDGRENVGVDVFEIDVGALQAWIQAHLAPKPIDIIYVTFDPATVDSVAPYTVARSKNDYPALRLVNGAQLRYPLTIATDRPVYVKGNFNTVGWQPASILGDAITFLSPAWSDGHASHDWGNLWTADPNEDHGVPATTNATPMSVYAAIAAGHSATPCDVNRLQPPCDPADFTPPPLTGGSYPNYGGGLENFPRFLENWGAGGGVTMLYRGSLVSLFQSRYANRKRWSWVDYYSPPTRDWAFDLQFRDPTKLPPGTPTVGSVIQTAFRPIY